MEQRKQRRRSSSTKLQNFNALEKWKRSDQIPLDAKNNNNN